MEQTSTPFPAPSALDVPAAEAPESVAKVTVLQRVALENGLGAATIANLRGQLAAAEAREQVTAATAPTAADVVEMLRLRTENAQRSYLAAVHEREALMNGSHDGHQLANAWRHQEDEQERYFAVQDAYRAALRMLTLPGDELVPVSNEEQVPTRPFCEAAAEDDHDWNELDECRECGISAF